MIAQLFAKKRLWKRALLLFTIGAALSVLLQTYMKKPASTFLSDLLFTIASVFLVAGLWGLINNLGAFNSLKYGTRSLIRMLKGKRDTPRDKMAGGYLEYVQARPKDEDAPWTLLFAFAFLCLSALAALTTN